jgi:N-methylhydantoinase A/oxoprolinase/acetone carboxylase beta subunit
MEMVWLAVEYRIPLQVPVLARPPRDSLVTVRTRQAWFGGSFRECAVYDGETLPSNNRVVGPSFIEFATTTVVIYEGQRAEIDDYGNVHLEVGGHES